MMAIMHPGPKPFFSSIQGSIQPMSSDRITELEIRQAFQEELLETLNQVVAAQQQQVELLQGQVRLLYQQLRSLQPSDIVDPAQEPPPPHY